MATIRSWTQIWPCFMSLCILNLVLDVKIIALGDDSGSGGVTAENTCKNTNYQSFLPPPYQNTSHMICTPVWHTYELRYTQNGDTTTIILSAPYTIGWVGIGFSRDGMMVGSSAMVGWISKHGHAKIKQFYLRGRKQSEVIVDKGELPLNNVPAAVATNGAEIHLAFQLQMTTPFEKQPVLLAFGSKYPQNHHLSKHEDRTAIVFDFSSVNYTSTGSTGPASHELIQMRTNHGILGIMGWGLILPVGAIIARYFRHKDPLWFYLHAVIQFVGFTFGLGTVVLGLQLYSKMHVHIPAHRGIGIFALVLSILQIFAFFLRPNKDSKIRKIWNWYHSWFGRLALIFAAINIVLGMQAAGAGSDWKIGYGFLVGIVVVAAIVLEVLAYLKRSEMRSLPPNFQMDPVGEATFPSNQALTFLFLPSF
ncbi:Cytochrome b561 and DOMON domain-containing protein, partial [Mucuna pruriens]